MIMPYIPFLNNFFNFFRSGIVFFRQFCRLVADLSQAASQGGNFTTIIVVFKIPPTPFRKGGYVGFAFIEKQVISNCSPFIKGGCIRLWRVEGDFRPPETTALAFPWG